jgi:hypothetical protein
LKNNPDDDSLENLETELRETSPVLYRSWFEEKVNELRKT